ncbi:GTP-binding protein HSR1 [Hyphomicrobium methylovorum]|uniref:GTP-binding protein HSR1 n=1 Tax=Hyphomicrobium methylovorum TaxID=84 RepID=UPI001FE433F4|nr:GTP-binding protein HSR1 [Hyphomicrobium methylovorum]
MRDTLTPLRSFIIFLGLLFPTLALIPLGSLWLWQNGYLIYWAGATLACTLIAYIFERTTLSGVPERPTVGETLSGPAGDLKMSDGVDPLRARAEAAVEQLANKAATETIDSWDGLLQTGLNTVETVAKVYHPDRDDPMLRFTVPEALTLVEQVSGRLRPVFEGIIPFGGRLTVAQFAQIYRWRGIYDFAGRAWSIWRVLRVVNPATALTYEMRERLSGSLLQWLKGSITGRLSRAFVNEVGAASVDLYSGELRRAAAAGRAQSKSKVPPPASDAEPQA